MKNIRLFGTKMKNRDIAHEYIREKLEYPPDYGKNLDALWDMLSTESMKMHIILTDVEPMMINLGDYGDGIIQTFEDAASENPNITFTVLE